LFNPKSAGFALRLAVPLWIGTVALFLGIAIMVPRSFAQSKEADAFGLPKGNGRETVYVYCGACHSLRLVSQQRLPRYRWEELLVVMNEKHGMPKMPPEKQKIVTDYLAEFLGPPPQRRRF
jgi:hypothetical protein